MRTTGGNGPLTGQEVEFDVTLTTPIDLAAGQYFFVPQVALTNGGQFYWLSASRPVVNELDIHGNPTTPFPTGFNDLQAWTRDAMLDPDWLRVGTDIVDTIGMPTAPTFNAAFSLSGTVVPEPATTVGVAIGLGFIGYRRWRTVTRGKSFRA